MHTTVWIRKTGKIFILDRKTLSSSTGRDIFKKVIVYNDMHPYMLYVLQCTYNNKSNKIYSPRKKLSLPTKSAQIKV